MGQTRKKGQCEGMKGDGESIVAKERRRTDEEVGQIWLSGKHKDGYSPHAHGNGCGGYPHDDVKSGREKWQLVPG